MIDTVKFVDFLIEKGLTPNQFLLGMLIKLRQYETLYKYWNEGSSNGWTDAEIEDMIEKGFLISIGKSRPYAADELMVTEKFYSSFMTDDGESAAEEFLELYPAMVKYRDGRRVGPLKGGRGFNRDLFIRKYAQEIGWNKELHQQVMLATRYALDNLLPVFVNVTSFIQDGVWRDIYNEMTPAEDDFDLPGEKLIL
jgi:hypothetical protein